MPKIVLKTLANIWLKMNTNMPLGDVRTLLDLFGRVGLVVEGMLLAFASGPEASHLHEIMDVLF